MSDKKLSPDHDLYRQLDDQINGTIGGDVGYTLQIAPRPYPMDRDTVAGFGERYRLIKEFQETTVSLFGASLRGEEDPDIARMVLEELPGDLGTSHHRVLTERQHRTPVFFRTDEVVPGKLSEIQCSGSGWGVVEQLRELYCDNEGVFGPAQHFSESLAARFARALSGYLGEEPLVHHLVDNASRPHGIRHFIQRTRRQGVRYFSYDQGVGPGDCNFVRSHDFFSLAHHNFFSQRLEACDEARFWFDLPPSVLFDGKIILAWPFWSKTRHRYSDEIREMFPFTTLVESDGIELEEGRMSLDEFCKIPMRRREFYLKYAGTDIGLNWGSKSVFSTSSLSRVKCRELLDTILEDHAKGRYWVVQRSHLNKEHTEALARDGTTVRGEGYSKFSGYYGPEGLMALMVFQDNRRKVHGGSSTISSIVH